MADHAHGNPDLLLANLIARVICAIVGILLCWVPFRLLLRNGEFASVVLIVDVVIMNIMTIVNASIWPTDDWRGWWDGRGLCDVEVYITAPLETMYAACVFTIMFNLAQQMRLKRASADRAAWSRRNLIQAAIIFPIPAVQIVFTYFDLAQRYIIGAVAGCIAIYDTSWPKTVVFDIPGAVFSILAVPYAILLWRRYHKITKQTQGILKSNSEISIRASRTRRRLYYMCLSILVVYLPVTTYFTYLNIRGTVESFKPYSFERIRMHGNPYPWSTILFTPSWILPSAVLNFAWIPIATTVVIVIFFGMTVEARAMYRQYASVVGLDVVYDWLKARLKGSSGRGFDEGEQGANSKKKRTNPPNSRTTRGRRYLPINASAAQQPPGPTRPERNNDQQDSLQPSCHPAPGLVPAP
ncbi:pheromone A receptor-domain-containing protein [Xylariaceae sp. FL0594]|nr:pheromone A receptor-domain-containing protein [Xylariaceae sp. FL0594]